MKKTVAIMLLSALLFTACGETNLDTSSDISSQTVSQTVSEDASSDISSETASNTISEEEQDQLYIQKAKESLAVENPQEIIDALKAMDEYFEGQINSENLVFEFDKYPLIQVHEYTLEEYAETGKIEPRATNEYYYRDDYHISEWDNGEERGAGISNLGERGYGLYSYTGFPYALKTMEIDPKTMAVTLVQIDDLGLYYYVDDGKTQLLRIANDVDGGYALDNSAMLLAFDTTDGKPYGHIVLNENTQLRAKGIVADDKEYSQMMREIYGEGNPTTGGKGWDDKTIFSDYFRKIVDECHIQEFGELIVPKHMQYFGESNGWRIYHVVYSGQIYDAVYFEMDLGGYKFKCNGILSPSASGIYAIKRKEVLTLKEAYEKGEIDIKEVHDFTPEEYKAD